MIDTSGVNLTPRRQQMLKLHQAGRTNQQIAAECQCSSMAVSKFLRLLGLSFNTGRPTVGKICDLCRDREGHWLDYNHKLKKVDLKLFRGGTYCKVCRDVVHRISLKIKQKEASGEKIADGDIATLAVIHATNIRGNKDAV